jgi:hypothetical protein
MVRLRVMVRVRGIMVRVRFRVTVTVTVLIGLHVPRLHPLIIALAQSLTLNRISVIMSL